MVQESYSLGLEITGQRSKLSEYIKSNKQEFKFSNNDSTIICTVVTIPEQEVEDGTVKMPPMLVVLTSFTGGLDNHLKELVENCGKVIRGMLAFCKTEGKPIIEDDDLFKFLKKSKHKDTFYVGQQFIGKADMFMEEGLSNKLSQYIDLNYERIKGLKPLEIKDELLEHAKKHFSEKELDFKVPFWDWWRVKGVGKCLTLLAIFSVLFFIIICLPKYFIEDEFWKRAIASIVLFVVIFSPIVIFALRIINHEKHLKTQRRKPSFEKYREVYKSQNREVLNEIALAGPVKPGKIRRNANKVMFRAANFMAFTLNIPTVFNARWIGFNNYYRFTFFSNFSNQTEGYTRDFIDSTPRGMKINAIYNNASGYPKTRNLIFNGAIDNPNEYVQNLVYYQHITELWYMPLNHLSIDNIRVNHAIRKGLLKKMNEKQATEWLKYFGSYKKYARYKKPMNFDPGEQIVQISDIQGVIKKGYGKHEGSVYALLQMSDKAKGKEYLNSIKSLITRITSNNNDVVLNVAFTYKGLQLLGIEEKVVNNTFQREFVEGMAHSIRAPYLGDEGSNDPINWKWGGPKNDDAHILLLIYGKDQNITDKFYNKEKLRFIEKGISEVYAEKGRLLPNGKEHFGFKDGIAKPAINGIHNTNVYKFKTGEFVLGYMNEYNNYSDSPKVKVSDFPNANLDWYVPKEPDRDNEEAYYDLGKNGTYLVYRQMSQRVKTFWKYQSEQNNSNKFQAIKTASKMVGRWPNGDPLVKYPEKPSDSESNDDNNFMYYKNDIDGLKCPYGSHIRRTNPRDWLITEKDNKISSEMIRKHQMLRRGRPWGEPLVDDLNTEKLIELSANGDDNDDERGLHFLAIVSSISRQFEFVQNTWVKSTVFGALTGENDPIIGTKKAKANSATGGFTCPAHPIRKKYKEVPQFTRVVGGEYFFMPGLRAYDFIIS
jgi:Dyp-type peroxidase family